MLLEFPGELDRAIRDRKGWSTTGRVSLHYTAEMAVEWAEAVRPA